MQNGRVRQQICVVVCPAASSHKNIVIAIVTDKLACGELWSTICSLKWHLWGLFSFLFFFYTFPFNLGPQIANVVKVVCNCKLLRKYMLNKVSVSLLIHIYVLPDALHIFVNLFRASYGEKSRKILELLDFSVDIIIIPRCYCYHFIPLTC